MKVICPKEVAGLTSNYIMSSFFSFPALDGFFENSQDESSNGKEGHFLTRRMSPMRKVPLFSPRRIYAAQKVIRKERFLFARRTMEHVSKGMSCTRIRKRFQPCSIATTSDIEK
ncbi:hypothetical protein TNIN_369201 [Trichonephila inaurata madagascariensis]|uniref:Uncharacterized protein n=1 Tax=Trichonephila inaurata madagascariensis TaxID=2747483 RepID=A0A8X6XV89_9ARAC|nr:hypothetical protein TNIN_369201 [Trichonephila inaurata madagascariensis]